MGELTEVFQAWVEAVRWAPLNPFFPEARDLAWRQLVAAWEEYTGERYVDIDGVDFERVPVV